MEKKLMRYFERHKKYVIDLTSKLIKIPTINPPGEHYKDMVDALKKECREIGLKVRTFVTPKAVLEKYGINSGSDRISLLSDWNVDNKKTFHINSHYDVVPATDKWSTDPFKPVIKRGRIYGRGAEDMKGNIACVLYAIMGLKELNITPGINLQLSFTPDEETGGRTGLGFLVQKNLVKADYAMSEGYSASYVSMGNKGVLWAEVTVEGRSSHASIPHKGVNSFERMLELCGALKQLKKRILRRKTQYNMRDAVSKSPTFVMGGYLSGGIKVNVVPGISKFSIDRRLIPEENTDLAKDEIMRVIERFNKKYKDSKFSVKFTSQESPSISKRDEGFFNIVSDAIEFITGTKAEFSVMPGATDMRYFMWKGIPSLGYTPRGGESWHSDNEFVYIDGLIETAKIYSLIMKRLS